MIDTQTTSWVILAGGQATRMGGQDKGLIEFNGKPLIEHVMTRLSLQHHDIYINANRHQEHYQRYAPVFCDSLANYPGPLGGIHAALTQLSKQWIGFVPCDSPYLPEDLVSRLCAGVTAATDLVAAHDGQYPQPVFTLIHRRTLPTLEAFLASGERKMQRFHQQVNTEYVDFSDSPNAFINLNTPQQLTELGQNKNE